MGLLHELQAFVVLVEERVHEGEHVVASFPKVAWVKLQQALNHAHAEAVKAAGVDPMSVLSAPPEDYTTPGDTVPSRYPGISRKRRH